VNAARERVGARIKSARAEKGWKQKHLAAEVRVEPITVSRWERGATTPDFDALGLIADATGKPLSYFLADDEAGRTGPELSETAARLEAAADRIATEAERIATALAELRVELARLR
jgi:transcriptional regulator with XRE-family HTH domain